MSKTETITWEPEPAGWSSHGFKPGDPDTIVSTDGEWEIQAYYKPTSPYTGHVRWSLYGENGHESDHATLDEAKAQAEHHKEG